MRANILVLGLFCCIAVGTTWPLVMHMNTLVVDREDGLLITWYLNWSIHHPGNYNANTFYPYNRTLAYSETMLPIALLVGPIVRLVGEPLVAYNLTFLMGFALSGFSMYMLLKLVSGRVGSSMLLAIIFNLSAMRLVYIDMVQLQLFNIWPFCFAVYFLLQKKRLSFVVFFVIACLTTALYLYFLLVVMGVLWLMNKNMRSWIGRTGFVGVVLVVPFLSPYLQVSSEFGYTRSIRDAIHFSMMPSDVLKLGLGFWLTLVLVARKLDKKYMTIALVGFVLALGPAVHFVQSTVHVGAIPAIPLPYAAFYYLIPGFSGFRAAFRWVLLFGIFAFVAGARHVKLSKWVWLGLVVITLWEMRWPIRYEVVPTYKDFPPEQVWLRDNYKKTPIVQFPIFTWATAMGRKIEAAREYYSTMHFHPMVNGYSGFSPVRWVETVEWLGREFPSKETIEYLRSIKVGLVVMPTDWLDPTGELRLVKRFSKASVYKIN